MDGLDRMDGLDWVDCPECGLPAFVVERFVRPSTDGPLPHAVTVCARLHHLVTTEESEGDPIAEIEPTAQATEPSTDDSAGQVDAGSA